MLRRIRTMYLVVPLGLAIVAPRAVAQDAGPTADRASGEGKAALCAGCHGMDGNPMNPEWPRLAGQQAAQIRKQLQDFQKGRRDSLFMVGIAGMLSDQDVEDVAAWFSANNTVPAGPSDSELIGLGEELWRRGKPEAGVLACAGCHDRLGMGSPTAIPGGIPSVRTQHAPYTARQLRDFRAGRRTNDWNGVMRKVSAALTDREIDAVAAYASNLP